ncbi:alpha/beta hydrolase [Antarctobacter sp.]|uniref:alpha/beta hydrolase n=1 Tax=Antarctobacter sp. TaxID=1872577 RepID=UPI003A959925
MDLTDAYAIGAHIPDGDAYPPRWAATAGTYRKRLSVAGRARLGLMYGHGTRCALDLFLPDARPKGLVVFVHGGYWLRFDRSSWSHLAEGARVQGWAVAMPSYDLCPRVRISDITRQVANAVTVAASEIPGPVRLTGHSAGGHLVARMAAALEPEVAARLAHILPISPLSDLRPLMQTEMNADLRIDAAEARAESPIFSPPPACPVTVWVGADERPALLDQARKLSRVWECGLVVEADKHHFDVIDALADPDSEMVARLLSD